MLCVRVIACTMCLPSLSFLPALAGEPQTARAAPANSPIAAVWKQQKMDFFYFGRTSRYSCDGLSDKVKMLLTHMGVRRDMSIRSYGCEIGRISLHGVNPGLHLEFFAPVPRAMPEKSLPTMDPLSFEAKYEPFAFEQDAFRNLGVGDCELIEEFARQILPKLSTNLIKQSISCIPYQNSAGSYSIRGQVLKSVVQSGS